MLPATMMPEILLRRTTNPALEGAGVVGDDPVDVGFAIAGRGHRDFLVVHDVLAVRLPQPGGEHHWRTEAQGEHRGSTRRLGKASEEGNPARGEPHCPLI